MNELPGADIQRSSHLSGGVASTEAPGKLPSKVCPRLEPIKRNWSARLRKSREYCTGGFFTNMLKKRWLTSRMCSVGRETQGGLLMRAESGNNLTTICQGVSSPMGWHN
jgi:hypothetical protein